MPGPINTDNTNGYDIVVPEPDSLIESLRAFGYTPQTAIADLIDNSITAGAKNVWIQFIWRGSESYITVRDDGRGMSGDELLTAMRAGSKNPLCERGPRDLGRFGLGMKTASFSQCRWLTVASKTDETPLVIRRWDLDHVGKVSAWQLLHGAHPDSLPKLSPVEDQAHGTLVLWEHMDRLVGSADIHDQKAQKRFYDSADKVERHIAMTFHRIIGAQRGVSIYVNGHRIYAWDPFLTKESATQSLPKEILYLGEDAIEIRPYILPHHSKLTREVHEQAGGQKGWNAQQGFYVYRNQRLLLAGDWLGLGFQKEEHYKLARIRVDLPNSMDQDWDIDVRKSRARPPGILHDDLRRIAYFTRERAVEVYRHRGKILMKKSPQNDIAIWHKELLNGRVRFKINREQSLVSDLLQASRADHEKIEALLRLIEETLPVQYISLEDSLPANSTAPFADSPPSELKLIMKQLYLSYRQRGLAPDQVKERLIMFEPFQQWKTAILSINDNDMMGDVNE